MLTTCPVLIPFASAALRTLEAKLPLGIREHLWYVGITVVSLRYRAAFALNPSVQTYVTKRVWLLPLAQGHLSGRPT